MQGVPRLCGTVYPHWGHLHEEGPPNPCLCPPLPRPKPLPLLILILPFLYSLIFLSEVFIFFVHMPKKLIYFVFITLKE